MYNYDMPSKKQVMQVAKRLQVFCPRELNAPRRLLAELVNEGFLEHSTRGVYRVTHAEPSLYYSVVTACARVPMGVVSLLTALRFHGIGTQNPGEVWLTIPLRAHRPKVDYPPIRFTRASGESYAEGIEYHTIEGRKIPVYSIEKTIADCFKFRNKIGLDVALEALKDALRSRKATTDGLWRFGKINRVANVMQPYLEAIQ